jgi:hypothetical protein
MAQNDLVIPPVPWRKQKTNLCRPPQAGLRAFHADCKAIGIRKRRNHDTRRTFISLARAADARLDLLRWITHGPSAGLLDLAAHCLQLAFYAFARLCDFLARLAFLFGRLAFCLDLTAADGAPETLLEVAGDLFDGALQLLLPIVHEPSCEGC